MELNTEFQLSAKNVIVLRAQKGLFLDIYSVSRVIEWILNTTEADEVRFDLCNVNSLS